MPQLRELIKRTIPGWLRNAVVDLRETFAAPALENIVLHDYTAVRDTVTRPRLSLVIPSVHPEGAFGGVTTAVDIFLETCLRTGADARVITDDFERSLDRSFIDRRASALGLKPGTVEIVPRTLEIPLIPVRSQDIFIAYNWYIALNLRSLIDQQVTCFGGEQRPVLYIIQDYEPLFYKFSSTHMLSRLAFDPGRPCWGIFNSSQLHTFFEAQGHQLERSYVFEPKLPRGLRPGLEAGPIAKAKRILVYGRPQIPRNCFPAVEKGLKLWAERYPQFADWTMVSAGLPHKPVPIAPGRALTSLGKLPLDEYAKLLRTTSVGLSLMASPHPSYPPLEMAHFGALTITNRYANKDLGTAHDNFISLPDIDAATIAAALATACERFEADPDIGWKGSSHVPSYLDKADWTFLAELAADLKAVWAS
jgi:O-antigen biosynthesis protein